MPIATVPQKQMRMIPFVTLEPPVFAATAPDSARKTIENEYW